MKALLAKGKTAVAVAVLGAVSVCRLPLVGDVFPATRRRQRTPFEGPVVALPPLT
jgi:hypothetical protein